MQHAVPDVAPEFPTATLNSLVVTPETADKT